MSEIKTCSVVNQADNEIILLTTEWSADGFTITIVPTSSVPQSGTMDNDTIDEFAKNLGKTQSEYLEEMRVIFSGKDPIAQFIFRDDILRWKKNLWNYGKVVMHQQTIYEITQSFRELLGQQKVMEETLQNLQTENHNLKSQLIDFEESIKSITNQKHDMEKVLYKKFLIILNSKKKRIRELEEQLQAITCVQSRQSVYEAQTDDSDASLNDVLNDKPKLDNRTTQSRIQRVTCQIKNPQRNLSKTEIVGSNISNIFEESDGSELSEDEFLSGKRKLKDSGTSIIQAGTHEITTPHEKLSRTEVVSNDISSMVDSDCEEMTVI